MKKIILLLAGILVLAGSFVACKKTEVVWPEVAGGSGNPNPNPNKLDSVAVYTITGNAQTKTRDTIYRYSVQFIVYGANDLTYSKPIYSVSVDSTLTTNYTTANPLQIVLPVHLPIQDSGCIQRSQFVVNKLTILLDSTKHTHQGSSYYTYGYDTLYTSEGGEANGSGKCESFTQGTTSDGVKHMIFSQTGKTLLQ